MAFIQELSILEFAKVLVKQFCGLLENHILQSTHQVLVGEVHLSSRENSQLPIKSCVSVVYLDLNNLNVVNWAVISLLVVLNISTSPLQVT